MWRCVKGLRGPLCRLRAQVRVTCRTLECVCAWSGGESLRKLPGWGNEKLSNIHIYNIHTIQKTKKPVFILPLLVTENRSVTHTQKWKQKKVFVIEVFFTSLSQVLFCYAGPLRNGENEKKKKGMCDGGLKREDVLCASRRWPKRHLHSAGPNGGQPVSGHLLLALLPLHHSTTFILCLFVFFPSLSSCQVKTAHDLFWFFFSFQLPSDKWAHHNKSTSVMKTENNVENSKNLPENKGASTEEKQSHWSLERNIKGRWEQHSSKKATCAVVWWI